MKDSILGYIKWIFLLVFIVVPIASEAQKFDSLERFYPGKYHFDFESVNKRYDNIDVEEEKQKMLSDYKSRLEKVTGTPVIKANESDSLVLVKLYDSTSGDDWFVNQNWLTSEPVRTWYGVYLNAEGQVDSLILPSNFLSGQLPKELGDFSNISYLSLSNNELNSAIPSEIGNLTNLEYLILNTNQLSGQVPAELGDLKNLSHLYLHQNKLNNTIPASLGNLENLKELLLYENELKGVIPSGLGNLSSVKRMNLGNNQLSGAIPQELGDLNNVETLTLFDNKLTGEIPPELGGLDKLKDLFLNDNDLTGTIPSELGDLSALESLFLVRNQLTGVIPVELAKLSNLTYLSLSQNQLKGVIPIEFAGLSNLISLRLFDNQLTGEIPSELGNLKDLEVLYLFDNQLTGNIPPELGNLENLEVLYLSNNRLESLPDLSSLKAVEFILIDSLKLTFKDIIPNLEVASDSIIFYPQYPFGDTTIVQVDIGSDASFGVEEIAFYGNQYQWEKDGFLLQGETDIDLSLQDITNFQYGEYVVRVTNDLSLPGVEIKSEPFFVTIDGKIVASENDPDKALPTSFSLSQNYPNPFNPNTNINYDIPEATNVKIEVFDIGGRLVKTLENTRRLPGTYSTSFDASGLSSGVYIYRIETDFFTKSKRMLLIK